MIEPRFQRLTIEHLEFCFAIWQSLEEHYDHPVGGEWTRTKMAFELENHEAYGVFGENNDLISFCFCRRVLNVLEILLLATRPRAHRTGAMRALVRSLIADLDSNDKVWLEVHAGNIPAIALYEALGFQLTGERKGYYSDGGKALLFEYKPLQ